MLPAQTLHVGSNGRQGIRGVDERPPLKEGTVPPEQALELRWIVAAQPAPENEQMAPCHAIGGIKLEIAQMANGVEDIRRGAIEQLGTHGDASGPLGGQLDLSG